MSKNEIHAGGYLDHVTQLKKKEEAAIKSIEQNAAITPGDKVSIIRTIRNRFRQLFSGVTKNLYLEA